MSNIVLSRVRRSWPTVVLASAALGLTLCGSGCGVYGYGIADGSQQYARMYSGPLPLTLVNDVGRTACYVRMSPSPAYSMGDDWLGPTETVGPGASRTFNVATRGAWDVRIEDCDHDVIAAQRSVPVRGPVQMMMSTLRPSPEGPPSGGEDVALLLPPPPLPSSAATVLPAVVVHASVNAQVNVLDPGAGIASSNDVITLRDGTLLRGHVAELHPGQRATLVLLTGEVRTVAWAEVANATGPSFTAIDSARH